jgi:hypothetical protein
MSGIKKPNQIANERMTRLFPEGNQIEMLGAEEIPNELIWTNATQHILAVENRWTVHSRSLKPGATVWRECLKVLADNGLVGQIYRDLTCSSWFLARVHD